MRSTLLAVLLALPAVAALMNNQHEAAIALASFGIGVLGFIKLRTFTELAV